MKILITLPVKVGFDGMTKQVLSYCKYMDKSDVEFDLLSCRGFDPKIKSIVKDAGFNHVYRIECRDTNQVKYFFSLLSLMRKRKYDVIHANGQSATLAVEMLAAKLSGCKVRIAHSHNSKCNHKKAHQLLRPVFMSTYTDAIACSKEAGDWLFRGRPYWILNNGIDIDKFKFSLSKRERIREELNLSSEEVAVGNVAAFEPWKNHAFIIEAFHKLVQENSKYKLYLWGINGTTRDAVLQQIKNLKLENNVFYMGTSDHIEDYLQAMDLMVLPSWYEGFPVTVVEWQANGLPCIISNSISKKTNITGLVKFLPIDKGVTVWSDEIKKHGINTEDRNNPIYGEKLRDSGYDISANVAELKKHYKSQVNSGK